jgi:transposase
VVDFLTHLLRQLPGKLLVLWDRLPGHKARLNKDFVAAQRGRLLTDYLPAYVPELNSVEYIWATGKSMRYPTSTRAISAS